MSDHRSLSRRKWRYTLIGIVVMVLLVVATGYLKKRGGEDIGGIPAELQVVTSIYPIYDLVSTVGGAYVDVTLIAHPSVPLHTVTFDYRKVVREDTDAIFIVGHGLDDADIPEQMQGRIVRMDRNIDLLLAEGSTASPYYWLSVRQAPIMVETIAAELIRLDPEHERTYVQNAETLIRNLLQIDATIQALFAESPRRSIAVYGHDWAYFARDYDLDIVQHAPLTSAPLAEDQVRAFSDAVNDFGLQSIFVDLHADQASLLPIIASRAAPFALLTLDSVGGIEDRTTYALLMARNARTIFEGL